MAEVLRSGGNEGVTMRRFLERVSDEEMESLLTAVMDASSARMAVSPGRALIPGLVSGRFHGVLAVSPGRRRSSSVFPGCGRSSAIPGTPRAVSPPAPPRTGRTRRPCGCSRHGSRGPDPGGQRGVHLGDRYPLVRPEIDLTVPIGSTSMLRPIPVGARSAGEDGSGTWPAGGDPHSVLDRPRTHSVTPVLLLEQARSQAAGTAPATRAPVHSARASSGNRMS